MKDMVNGTGRSPEKKTGGRRTTRGAGSVRSESPTKKTPARKIATPRKSRKGRGAAASVEPEAVNGEQEQGTVKVEVEETSKPGDGEDEPETSTTKVKVHMPTDHPDLKLPGDTEGMLAKAREMVAEAEKIAPGPSTSKGKRKADEIFYADDEVAARPAKRANTVEMELRKERMKRRALTGIAASLVVGYVYPDIIRYTPAVLDGSLTTYSAIIPVVMTAFGS